MNRERFMDRAPGQIEAGLLDPGRYWCHWRSIDRILHDLSEVRARRNQPSHPAYQKPELLAEAPHPGWSGDITRWRGPGKWTPFARYTVLDRFSRFRVGWMIAEPASAQLSRQLIAPSAANQQIQPEQVTRHADNGKPMPAKTLALRLRERGIEKSHSGPYVSEDNRCSQAPFKTVQAHPPYPDRLGGVQEARAGSRPFFHWDNSEPDPSGLNWLTPALVHYGQAEAIRQPPQAVLAAASPQFPQRFVRGEPLVKGAPAAGWINPPVEPTLP
jgi:putative transposase